VAGASGATGATGTGGRRRVGGREGGMPGSGRLSSTSAAIATPITAFREGSRGFPGTQFFALGS
jgi:hypothetical protein